MKLKFNKSICTYIQYINNRDNSQCGERSVIISSPSCNFKPVWLSIFDGTQKKSVKVVHIFHCLSYTFFKSYMAALCDKQSEIYIIIPWKSSPTVGIIQIIALVSCLRNESVSFFNKSFMPVFWTGSTDSLTRYSLFTNWALVYLSWTQDFLHIMN